MPWNTPRTWVAGAVGRASEMNQSVRDNLAWLRNAVNWMGAANAGDGSRSVAQVRSVLGLGSAAYVNTGTAQGNVPVLGAGGRLGAARVPATRSWGSISGKPATFVPSAHTHPHTQITGLGSAATKGSATTDAEGTARRATDARAKTGTNTTDYVTPDHLRRFGLAVLATANIASGTVPFAMLLGNNTFYMLGVALIRVVDATDDVRVRYAGDIAIVNGRTSRTWLVKITDGKWEYDADPNASGTVSDTPDLPAGESGNTVDVGHTYSTPGVGAYLAFVGYSPYTGGSIGAGTLTATIV